MNELANHVRALLTLPETFIVKDTTTAAQIDAQIAAILNVRRTFKREYPGLYTQLCTYTATLADVGQVDLLASLCNLTTGPVLFRVASKGGGYGLFAEQDYAVGRETKITKYDGVRPVELPSQEEADYVVETGPRAYIDGKYGFQLENKGRWINEPNVAGGVSDTAELKTIINVELSRLNRYFFPLIDIRRGTELEWYYGPKYQRPWLRILQPDELPARRKRLKP